MVIKVPAWGKEPDPAHPGEFWDVQAEEEKELACGKGAAFFIQGRYFVWGEIAEIKEDEQIVRVMYNGVSGWLHLSEIKDVVPHNALIMQQAFATASLASMQWFSERTPDKVQNLSMADMAEGAKIYGDP
jgi:hypothetical protein